MTRFHSIFLILLAIGAGPASAHAQDLTPREVRRYKTLGAESAKLYEQGEYEAALEKLFEAREIYAHRDIDYNIGLAQAELGQCTAARSSFRDFIARDDVNEQERNKARQQLRELRSCREPGYVTFDCKPNTTGVYLRGNSVPCGARLPLDEGSYRARASATGYVLEELSFDIVAGEEIVLDVHLEEIAEAPRGSDGRRKLAFGALAVGGVAILGGIAIDATAAGRARSLQSAADEAEFEQLQAGARRSRTWAGVFYVTGILSTLTGGALLLLDSGSPKAGDTSLRLGVGPREIQVVLSW